MNQYTVILLGDEGWLQAIRVETTDQEDAVLKARKASLDAYIAENFPDKENSDVIVDEWEAFYTDFLIIDGHPNIELLQDETAYSFRYLEGELSAG